MRNNMSAVGIISCVLLAAGCRDQEDQSSKDQPHKASTQEVLQARDPPNAVAPATRPQEQTGLEHIVSLATEELQEVFRGTPASAPSDCDRVEHKRKELQKARLDAYRAIVVSSTPQAGERRMP